MAINGISNNLLTNLLKTQKGLNQTFNRLSSGKKTDNATVNALASRLQSQSSGLSQANRNINQAQGSLAIQSGNVFSQIDRLQRARDIALQSANGTISDSDRANLQTEFDQIIEDVDSLGQDASSTTVQSGSNGGDTSSVELGATKASDLGVDTSGVSTQAAAEDAIGEIDAALDQLYSEAANIGAQQNSFEYASNANAIREENLRSAQSQAQDVDLASETAELARLQTLQSLQIETLKAKIDDDKKKNSLFVGLIKK